MRITFEGQCVTGTDRRLGPGPGLRLLSTEAATFLNLDDLGDLDCLSSVSHNPDLCLLSEASGLARSVLVP